MSSAYIVELWVFLVCLKYARHLNFRVVELPVR